MAGVRRRWFPRRQLRRGRRLRSVASFGGSATAPSTAPKGPKRQRLERRRFGGAASSYDRSFEGSRGGSIDTSGTRGVDIFPGGAAAGGTRADRHRAGGRSYSGSREAGAAVGPYGRAVGGDSIRRFRGPNGAFAGTVRRRTAFPDRPRPVALLGLRRRRRRRRPFDRFWSGGVMTTRAAAVRTSFPYYSAFRPAWYTAHPGAGSPPAGPPPEPGRRPNGRTSPPMSASPPRPTTTTAARSCSRTTTSTSTAVDRRRRRSTPSRRR